MDIQEEKSVKGTKGKSSCPEGWLSAGAKVPKRLTKRQEDYCRRAEGARRFCYKLYAVID